MSCTVHESSQTSCLWNPSSLRDGEKGDGFQRKVGSGIPPTVDRSVEGLVEEVRDATIDRHPVDKNLVKIGFVPGNLCPDGTFLSGRDYVESECTWVSSRKLLPVPR